jgi:hypothetical protein
MHGSTEVDILDTNYKCKPVHEPSLYEPFATLDAYSSPPVVLVVCLVVRRSLDLGLRP